MKGIAGKASRVSVLLCFFFLSHFIVQTLEVLDPDDKPLLRDLHGEAQSFSEHDTKWKTHHLKAFDDLTHKACYDIQMNDDENEIVKAMVQMYKENRIHAIIDYFVAQSSRLEPTPGFSEKFAGLHEYVRALFKYTVDVWREKVREQREIRQPILRTLGAAIESETITVAQANLIRQILKNDATTSEVELYFEGLKDQGGALASMKELSTEDIERLKNVRNSLKKSWQKEDDILYANAKYIAEAFSAELKSEQQSPDKDKFIERVVDIGIPTTEQAKKQFESLLLEGVEQKKIQRKSVLMQEVLDILQWVSAFRDCNPDKKKLLGDFVKLAYCKKRAPSELLENFYKKLSERALALRVDEIMPIVVRQWDEIENHTEAMEKADAESVIKEALELGIARQNLTVQQLHIIKHVLRFDLPKLNNRDAGEYVANLIRSVPALEIGGQTQEDSFCGIHWLLRNQPTAIDKLKNVLNFLSDCSNSNINKEMIMPNADQPDTQHLSTAEDPPGEGRKGKSGAVVLRGEISSV